MNACALAAVVLQTAFGKVDSKATLLGVRYVSLGDSFQNSNFPPCMLASSGWVMYGSTRGRYLCVIVPRLYVTLLGSPPSSVTTLRMPSSGETVYVGRRVADPPPDIFARLALGPMTAIVGVLSLETLMGRRKDLSARAPFFRRTTEELEARRSRARTSGVSRDSSTLLNSIPDSIACLTKPRIYAS